MAVTPKGTLGKKSSDSRRASRDLRKVIYVQLRGASILLVDTGVLGAGGGGVGAVGFRELILTWDLFHHRDPTFVGVLIWGPFFSETAVCSYGLQLLQKPGMKRSLRDNLGADYFKQAPQTPKPGTLTPEPYEPYCL